MTRPQFQKKFSALEIMVLGPLFEPVLERFWGARNATLGSLFGPFLDAFWSGSVPPLFGDSPNPGNRDRPFCKPQGACISANKKFQKIFFPAGHLDSCAFRWSRECANALAAFVSTGTPIPKCWCTIVTTTGTTLFFF